MRSTWRSAVDMGVVHYVSYPECVYGTGEIESSLRKILLDDYFSAVEITWIKDSDVRRRILDIMPQAGMRVVYAGGPPYGIGGINLAALDAEERADSLVRARHQIDEAYAFGARLHIITAGKDPGADHRDRARDHLVDSICELCGYARERATAYCLTLSMEPIDRDVHRYGFIGPTQEASDVARRVHDRGEYLGITLDQSHVAQLGEDPANAIKEAGEYLIHAHLANCLLADRDNPLYGDEHPYFGAPGTEHAGLEVQQYLLELGRNGFFSRQVPYGKRPIISMEVKPHADEQPDLILAATKRVVEDAWRGLSAEDLKQETI